MFGMELYATVRQLVFLDGLSRREVARRLGISRDTVLKASPTLHGVRPERADAADNSAEPRIGREKGKSATQPSRSFTKVSKKESSTIELAAPASEPRSHRRIPTLAAKWTKWKKPTAR